MEWALLQLLLLMAIFADVIDSSVLGRISSDLVGSIEDDLSSRQDWEDTYKQGLEFLGMKTEERTEPFEGSSGVVHPLLAESVTQFQAQAYRELLPANGPVRTQVIGAQNEMLVKQAERVKDYMNYQITYEMEEYDPELDQMLFYLPVVGSTFKKVYRDPLNNALLVSLFTQKTLLFLTAHLIWLVRHALRTVFRWILTRLESCNLLASIGI